MCIQQIVAKYMKLKFTSRETTQLILIIGVLGHPLLGYASSITGIVQTGGTLNSVLLRDNLIDKLHLVVAPILVGGKDTPTLVDGESLHTTEELSKLKPLKLIRSEVLKNSYLRLEYEVIN